MSPSVPPIATLPQNNKRHNIRSPSPTLSEIDRLEQEANDAEETARKIAAAKRTELKEKKKAAMEKQRLQSERQRLQSEIAIQERLRREKAEREESEAKRRERVADVHRKAKVEEVALKKPEGNEKLWEQTKKTPGASGDRRRLEQQISLAPQPSFEARKVPENNEKKTELDMKKRKRPEEEGKASLIST
ncbi:hypothetical protein BDP27DRAFT_1370377 [Rhodocollybia butyracea]|uniref:Uncharacterized protein n=1 Tax=Rhodocollybia butyracea TaxID=206335 RepID=A0A9P5PB59_9AGAR|nr:hypothetical protein BDP27DRAFT_1370377 [Rhodocollybia butyracea]